MSVSIWSTHLNKQIIVKGRLDEWVDSAMEGEEEIARLKKANKALCDQTLDDGKELDRLRVENEKQRQSLDAIKRLLDSGFVP